MIHGENLRILSADEDEIVLAFGSEKILLHPGDEIWMLSDSCGGEIYGDKNPKVEIMDFDEFYECLPYPIFDDVVYDWICAINVIRH